MVNLTRDLALEQAARADADLKGDVIGDRCTAPHGAKDLLATTRIPTTRGAFPFKDRIIDRDAIVVIRLCAAGADLEARLNMLDLAGGMGYRQPDRAGVEPLEAVAMERGQLVGVGLGRRRGARAVRHRHRNPGQHLHPQLLLRPHRPAPDRWPSLQVQGDGPELGPRQDRPDDPKRSRLRSRARRNRRA